MKPVKIYPKICHFFALVAMSVPSPQYYKNTKQATRIADFEGLTSFFLFPKSAHQLHKLVIYFAS